MDKEIDYYKNQMRIYNSFPESLEPEVEDIIKLFTFKSGSLSPSQFEVTIKGEKLKIPDRVYFDVPAFDEQEKLSPLQIEILSCILTRHHDGFIREKFLKKIISSKNYWVIPYVFQLIGEYVIEILYIIYDNRDSLNKNLYKQFLIENPIFYNKTKQRVLSYWSCYHCTSFPKLNEYVGQKIINYFDNIGN